MGMSIDNSERYLRLMLGGMKYAVKYWENRDKEESDIEQTNVEAVETALDTMCKYQKIKEIIQHWIDEDLASESPSFADSGTIEDIIEVLEDGNK